MRDRSTTTAQEMYSMNDVRRVAEHNGSHFFDAGSMRFFNSRIGDTVYRVPGYGAYFVTSEQYRGMDGHTEPRLYTVRFCDPYGRIDKCGEFQEHETGRQAKREALRLSLLDHS